MPTVLLGEDFFSFKGLFRNQEEALSQVRRILSVTSEAGLVLEQRTGQHGALGLFGGSDLSFLPWLYAVTLAGKSTGFIIVNYNDSRGG